MAEVQGGKVKKFLVKQFLPIGFVLCIIIALLFPEPGSFLYHIQSNGWKVISTINMCIIFFIFGITLDTSELKSAFKQYKALILGLVTILFLTALVGFAFIAIPFQPPEFGYGLAIFACVPTSLSQSVTLIIQSYGNGALGLLYTVLSNILGIFTAPVMVKLVLGSKIENADVDAADLLLKLGVSIIVPLVVGKLIRDRVPGVLPIVKEYKVPLYLFNNFQIIMIVWMTMSHSRHELLKQKAYDVLFAIMAAILQHFIFLVMNFLIMFVIRFPEAEKKAYIISGSHKSLPTAAVIINYLDPEAVGDLGLISIPCIVFYIMQLFIDSFIANSWAGKYEKGQALEDKYKDQLAELAKMDTDAPSLQSNTQPEPSKELVGEEVKVTLHDGSDDKTSLLGGHERSDAGINGAHK